MRFTLSITTLFFCTHIYTYALAAEKICNNKEIYLNNSADISFTENELLFVCGGDTPGWQDVPIAQSIRQIKVYLQARGFYNPILNFQDDQTLIVDPGSYTEINDINFVNAPKKFGEVSYAGVNSQTLNSKNLDLIRSWSEERLRAMGYPCPEVRTSASYATGNIQVDMKPGQKVIISEIKREPQEKLYNEALSRFDTISSGDLFNGDFLKLTSRRLNSSQLTSFTYLSPNCSEVADPSVIEQKLTLNKPRYLGFAIGASTEEFPLLQVEWMHSRLDKMATSLSAEIYLSSIKQSISADLEYFPFRKVPRFFISPNIEVANITEDIYESFIQRTGVGVGYIYDSSKNQVVIETSPVYNIEDNNESSSPEHTEFLAFETDISLVSHYFEYFQASPRTGYSLSFSWLNQNDKISAEQSINKYKIAGTFLINYGKVDPPVTIIGIRFSHSFIHIKDVNNIPQSYRIYLGGDDDLRGFSRKSINNNELGYQTASYLGLESRFANLLPYNLQPYLLFDLAKVGLDNNAWNSSLLTSPGLGIRWESPFGAFRTSAAYGFVSDPASSEADINEDWTWFLSFGKEF